MKYIYKKFLTVQSPISIETKRHRGDGKKSIIKLSPKKCDPIRSNQLRESLVSRISAIYEGWFQQKFIADFYLLSMRKTQRKSTRQTDKKYQEREKDEEEKYFKLNIVICSTHFTVFSYHLQNKSDASFLLRFSVFVLHNKTKKNGNNFPCVFNHCSACFLHKD